MEQFKDFTINDITESWDALNKCINSSKCDNFIALMVIKSKYEPLYNELLNNWNNDNAKVFMNNLLIDVYNAQIKE